MMLTKRDLLAGSVLAAAGAQDPAVGPDHRAEGWPSADTSCGNAIGSAENPMSDAALEAKFTGLADGVLPQARIRDLIALCWAVERAPDMAAIARAASV
jgi:hypothetical protein